MSALAQSWQADARVCEYRAGSACGMPEENSARGVPVI